MREEKNNPRHERKRSLIAHLIGFVILSLIIHALFVSVVFRKQFGKRATSFWVALQQQLTPAQRKDVQTYLEQRRETILKRLQAFKKDPDQNNLPAQLRAPLSTFGWVMFEEPASAKQA